MYIRLSWMVKLEGQTSTLTLVSLGSMSSDIWNVSGPSPTTVSFTMVMVVQASGRFMLSPNDGRDICTSSSVGATKSSGTERERVRERVRE